MSNNWEFHFRNMNHDHDNKVEFRVNHMGCAKIPYDDGRACCWKENIEYNPDGGGGSVYCPNDFVVNFADWIKVIKDGIELCLDVAIFIASEGTDEEALINAFADIFAMTTDAVKAALHENNVDIAALTAQAQASFPKMCASIGVDQATIKGLASHISRSNWAFIAGDVYKDWIKDDDSPINNKHGWSVFAKDHDNTHAAHHAFIYQGHLYYVFEDDTMSKLWGD